MGQLQEIRLPDVGETEGISVIEVLVSVGDSVAVDDSLLTLESDKASMDIPSTTDGKVTEIKLAVGDGVTADMVVAIVEAEEAGAASPEPAPASVPASPAPSPAPAPASAPVPAAAPVSAPAPVPSPSPAPQAAPPPRPPASSAGSDPVAFKKAHAGPAVRRLARELGVDLSQVQGTGRKARITKDDVRGYIKVSLERLQSGTLTGGVSGFAWPAMPEIDYSKFGPVETKPLARIRKLSAANVHRSWLHVPHVTQHEEADITEMEAFRKGHADEAKKRGVKLTPVAFLIKACAGALREFPEFNSSLDPSGENLILKQYYNIGVAVDTPRGLVVPVVRDVDRKGLYEIAGELIETSGRAREGKLMPKDFQGATFTISSLGGIGGTAFTPIVNAPEVAILGVSRSSMKPVWQGGEFVPRLILPLSISYDHRVIDGAQAARFAVYLSGVLSDLRRLLL